MAEKYFLIAIGGTGMRCLESFVYLCTIGMCDGMEFHVLMLDTDIQNGNFERVRSLISNYKKIRGENSAPSYNTFFSASIKDYVYTPIYGVENPTLKQIAKSPDVSVQDNIDITDLFFDHASQEFPLSHGYRAQTQVGSFLMYNGIVDSVEKFQKNGTFSQGKDISNFCKEIFDAAANARIFIFGSVFGGTGASSIPIIPRAIADAIKISKSKKLHDQSLFGCTLLTSYFKFNGATENEIKKQKLIADADKFAVNSQAALMFYEDDTTISDTYKKMYHIGWPVDRLNFDKNRPNQDVITGGADQRNPGHIVELIAASAAYDFFTEPRDVLKKMGKEITYKSLQYDKNRFSYDFHDFFSAKGSDFRIKLTSFYLLNFVLRDVAWDLNNLIAVLSKYNNVHYYSNLEEEKRVVYLNKVIQSFGFGKGSDVGWLLQLQRSCNSDKLLFNESSFLSDRTKDDDSIKQELERFEKFNYGELFQGGNYPYDAFRRSILTIFKRSKESKNSETPIATYEEFISLLYNSLTNLLSKSKMKQ